MTNDDLSKIKESLKQAIEEISGPCKAELIKLEKQNISAPEKAALAAALIDAEKRGTAPYRAALSRLEKGGK